MPVSVFVEVAKVLSHLSAKFEEVILRRVDVDLAAQSRSPQILLHSDGYKPDRFVDLRGFARDELRCNDVGQRVPEGFIRRDSVDPDLVVVPLAVHGSDREDVTLRPDANQHV